MSKLNQIKTKERLLMDAREHNHAILKKRRKIIRVIEHQYGEQLKRIIDAMYRQDKRYGSEGLNDRFTFKWSGNTLIIFQEGKEYFTVNAESPYEGADFHFKRYSISASYNFERLEYDLAQKEHIEEISKLLEERVSTLLSSSLEETRRACQANESRMTCILEKYDLSGFDFSD